MNSDERFAEEDNEPELGFAPEPEDQRRIAPDEPFRRDMILVPLNCGVCKLRMYAQEKYIGYWMACPDCGRLAEIRAVEPEYRVTVELNEKGALTLKSVKNDPHIPAMRTNVDYRTVEGAVDTGAEAIPFYGLDETSDDMLENVMDRFLQKTDDVRTPEEIRYERITRERAEAKAAERKKIAEETAEEKKARLLAELDRHRGQAAKSAIPGARLSVNPADQPAHNPVDKPTKLKTVYSTAAPPSQSQKADDFTLKTPSLMPNENESAPISAAKSAAKTESKPAPKKESTPAASKESAPPKKKRSAPKVKESAADYDRPWRHFFRPFFDVQNRRRFAVVWICGFLATAMFLNLYYFVIQTTDPARGSQLPFTVYFILFYAQYLITFCPMAVWGVMLFLNGMTVYSETKDGFNRIRRWIPFRVEFATHYLFWFLMLGWIGPFPGMLAGAIFEHNGMEYYFGGVNLLRGGILGVTTWFFLFPPLFLSVDANNRGLDLYHSKIWGSLFRRFFIWAAYYLLSFLILAPLPTAFYAAIRLGQAAPDVRYLLMAPAFLLTGLVLCTLTVVCVHLWFRLLGALAWSIHRK